MHMLGRQCEAYDGRDQAVRYQKDQVYTLLYISIIHSYTYAILYTC